MVVAIEQIHMRDVICASPLPLPRPCPSSRLHGPGGWHRGVRTHDSGSKVAHLPSPAFALEGQGRAVVWRPSRSLCRAVCRVLMSRP